jgi:hypothetical protein
MPDDPNEDQLIAALGGRADEIGQDDGFGLDKTARLTAQRERRAEDDRPKPLNPPFPYGVISIDLFLLGRLAGS